MRVRISLLGVAAVMLVLVAFNVPTVSTRADGLLQSTGTVVAGAMKFPVCTARGENLSATLIATAATTQNAVTRNTTKAATMSGTQATGNSTMSATMRSTMAGTTEAYLGVEIAAESTCGVRVVRLLANSPAAAAGLRAGDIIVAIDGQALEALLSGMMSMTQNPTVAATMRATAISPATADSRNVSLAFFNLVRERRPGDKLTLTIQRNRREEFNAVVTLGTAPAGLVTPVAGTAVPTVRATSIATAAR